MIRAVKVAMLGQIAGLMQAQTRSKIPWTSHCVRGGSTACPENRAWSLAKKIGIETIIEDRWIWKSKIQSLGSSLIYLYLFIVFPAGPQNLS